MDRKVSEATQRVEQFIDPREVFFKILHLLQEKHIEISSYHRLAESITRYYIDYEDKLMTIISNKLTSFNHEKLNALLSLETREDRIVPRKKISDTQSMNYQKRKRKHVF